MKLSAETLQENYDLFKELISVNISSPRKEKLLEYYESIEEILVLAPASSKEGYHNAFPGGYLEHVNRVILASIDMFELWDRYEEIDNFTKEELIFAAINHDLGKLGVGNKPGYIPNESEWHVKNQGAIYKVNTEIPYMTVPDRGIFNLMKAGIDFTENEYLGIKLHDGLYEEANKSYLVSYNPESRLRTSLPIILNQADMLASRVEWEKHWLPKIGQEKTSKSVQSKSYNNNNKGPSQQAYKQLAGVNPGLMEAFKNI